VINITGIDIHSYFVKELDRAVAFYRDKVGLKNVEGKHYEFELPDGSVFGLYQPTPESGLTWMPGYGVMFAVDDAKAAAKALQDNGVKIANPFETPACYMALGEDTECNHFIIHQRK